MRPIQPGMFLMGALCFTGSLFAQKTIQQKEAILQKITLDKRVEKAQISIERETPSFIEFSKSSPLPRWQALSQLSSYLSVRSGVDELRSSRITNVNVHVAVQEWKQYFRGIPVEQGAYRALMQDENTLLLAGAFYDIPVSFNTRPAITEQQALQFATQRIGAKKYAWEQVSEMLSRTTNVAVRRQLEAELKEYGPKGQLVIVKDFSKKGVAEMHLAYKFNIYAVEPLSRDWMYIDAQNGKVLFRNPIIHHASVPTTVNTRYAGNRTVQVKQVSGNDPNSGLPLVSSHPTSELTYIPGAPTYVLADDTRGNGIETYDMNGVGGLPLSIPGLYTQGKSFTDVDNNWTSVEHKRGGAEGGVFEAENDDIAFDAHWGAEMVYDYWVAKHGRLSYDNNNAKIKSFIHYGPAYDNAFWNGSAMTYGDGSGEEAGGFKPLTSLDVCGHEIGHGVCSFTSDLAYERESGAMNEALSDIWAACVENFAIKTIDPSLASLYKPFYIGEQISYGAPLRRMDAPKTAGNPDTYGGTNWDNPNCTPTLTNDYCGVHNNSGVLNKWFYLLTCGSGVGSGPDASYVITGADDGVNDLGNSYTVKGVGFNLSEQVTYMMELMLTSTATFAEAREASLQAAVMLSGSSCSNLVESVTNAWYAVGVGGAFVAPCVTSVGFVYQPSMAVNEGSATGVGCAAQKTISVPVIVPAAGSISVAVSGTAKRDEDYTLTTTSFSNAGSATKLDSILITVFNDGIVEGVETIKLTLTITNGGANPANTTYTVNITDDDVLPRIGSDSVTLLNESFTAANGFANPPGWTEVLEIPEGTFSVANPTPYGKNQWAIDNNRLVVTGKEFITGTTMPAATYNDLSPSQTRINTNSIIDARGLNNLRLSFDYTIQGEVDVLTLSTDIENLPVFDYMSLAYSLDGVNYSEFATDSIKQFASAAPSDRHFSATLPSFLNNQQFYLAFRWSNDANAGGPVSVIIDNVVLKGLPKKIETALYSSASNKLALGSDVYFYSQQDGDIIGRINKTGSTDYGCVTATVEKEGTSTFDLYTEGSNKVNKVGDKLIRFTAGNNASSGNNIVSLYYTEPEIVAIENATGVSRTAFYLYHIQAPSYTAATNSNTKKKVATYTAVTANGVVVGGVFSATINNGLAGFALGAPTTVTMPVALSGSLMDKNVTGAFRISNLYPNPVNNSGFVTIYTEKAIRLQAAILNVSGQSMRTMVLNLSAGENAVQVIKGKLATGTYLLRFTDVESGKIIKTQTFLQQ